MSREELRRRMLLAGVPESDELTYGPETNDDTEAEEADEAGPQAEDTAGDATPAEGQQ